MEMLREISNDKLTPKKNDSKVQNELYEVNDEIEYDSDGQSIPLNEY